MAHVQFTALIRLPFVRGSFEDPPQAQWDADKDRQLWKFISKSSKTSDLNWVELAEKFQVPPTFILQQAAWLYERHLDHVRNQMKKVSSSNVPTVSTTGASTLTTASGVAMVRTGSGGSGGTKTTAIPESVLTKAALSGRHWDGPSSRGGDPSVTVPPLSRTPSTNTITQSRAHTQQNYVHAHSTRSAQRSNLVSPKLEERRLSTVVAPPSPMKESLDTPYVPDSSSSSSSSSPDPDHPAHRSQLFKRPPRFKQQRPRDLLDFREDCELKGSEGSSSHGTSSLPFASATRRSAHDTHYQLNNKQRQGALKGNRFGNTYSTRQESADQQPHATTETMLSAPNSASESDAPVRTSATQTPTSPQANHRSELGKANSPKQTGPRSAREASEGTPSMGSSFSDIDDASISQSALEEALLSNMQHGRMSTLSRMSRYL